MAIRAVRDPDAARQCGGEVKRFVAEMREPDRTRDGAGKKRSDQKKAKADPADIDGHAAEQVAETFIRGMLVEDPAVRSKILEAT